MTSGLSCSFMMYYQPVGIQEDVGVPVASSLQFQCRDLEAEKPRGCLGERRQAAAVGEYNSNTSRVAFARIVGKPEGVQVAHVFLYLSQPGLIHHIASHKLTRRNGPDLGWL